MKRGTVVGGPRSGKSTLALALGDITGLLVFHMDRIFHKPGWVQRDHNETVKMAGKIEAKPRWIFEGGLSATYVNRCARADTLIWLDLPVTLRLRRIVKRWRQYRGQTRPDMADGCPDQLAPDFGAYIIRTSNTGRIKIVQAIAEAPYLTVHHICTAKRADTLLDWLRDDHKTHD